MKVVLDSNVLISVIGKRSKSRVIWNAFLSNIFTLIITPSILLEYEEILQQKAAPGASGLVIEILKEIPNVIFRKDEILKHKIKSVAAIDTDGKVKSLEFFNDNGNIVKKGFNC